MSYSHVNSSAHSHINSHISLAAIDAAKRLAFELSSLSFPHPISHVYNPLIYAWKAHEQYLHRFAKGQKKVLFLGMNPGPFGMMQTAIPFGEISFVRDWMGINSGVSRPDFEHPKRPIEGFSCRRSEVSGRRFWGLFRDHFVKAESFFEHHFVANYCPLGLLEKSGRNFTPNKLSAEYARDLMTICDLHLCRIFEIFKPDWIIGVGTFAHDRAVKAIGKDLTRIDKISHPSPANPKANRAWADQTKKRLHELGIW